MARRPLTSEWLSAPAFPETLDVRGSSLNDASQWDPRMIYSTDERSRGPVSCHMVPYRSEHASLVAELARHLWHPDAELNAAYLEWKYHQNPYIREPLIYLAFVDEQLAGMGCAFGTRWEGGEPSESFTLPCADDLVIDPAFRRRSLYQQITRVARDDLDRRGYRYGIILSAGAVTQRTSVLMHWRNAGQLRHVQRHSQRRTRMHSLAGRVAKVPIVWRLSETLRGLGGLASDHLFDRFDSRSARRMRRMRQRQSGAIFAQATPLPEEMESLVKRLPTDGRFRHVRDRTYFDWRFRNPIRNYRFVYAGGDRLDGYLVLQRALDRADRVSIVDWEAAERVGVGGAAFRRHRRRAVFDVSRLGDWGRRPPPSVCSMRTASVPRARASRSSCDPCAAPISRNPGCWRVVPSTTPATGTFE